MSRKRPRPENESPTHQLVASETMRIAGSESLLCLWREGVLCDVELSVDGQSFKAHRVILAAGSAYMRALFTSNMRECRTGQPITIEGITKGAFESVLTFLYSARVDVTPASLADVLQAASRLEVVSILELGSELLVSELAADSCVATWETAVALGRPECSRVVEACERFAQRHFKAVSEANGFQSLGLERLRSLCESPKLWADEPEVWRAILAWSEGGTRFADEEQMLDTLRLVRFELLSPAFLAEHVDKVLQALGGGKDLLLSAYRYHCLSPEARPNAPRRLPLPEGVQLNMDADMLEGWTCHLEVPYTHVSGIEEIRQVPEHAEWIFMGARHPDGTIALGAFGRRATLVGFFVEEEPEDPADTAQEENGCYWYFVHGCSMGFSRVPRIKLCAADVLGSGYESNEADEDGHYRLSWHTDTEDDTGDGGWRAGQVNDDGGMDGANWKKMVYFR